MKRVLLIFILTLNCRLQPNRLSNNEQLAIKAINAFIFFDKFHDLLICHQNSYITYEVSGLFLIFVVFHVICLWLIKFQLM